MRVIAGTARSLKLKTPEGIGTRPTTDRIKETLFNMLQADIPGSIFVDLYSGSGGIGIEALSRGAKKAFFIENDQTAFSCIQQNITLTRLEDRSVLIKQDVSSALSILSEKEVDIIFMDPPYQSGYEQKILSILSEKSYVTEHTLIIIEVSLETNFSFIQELGFQLLKEKYYKTNKHVFIKKQEG